MGRNRGRGGGGGRSGGNFGFANGHGNGSAAGGQQFSFADIDDEPKFIDLPDDYETESDKEEREQEKKEKESLKKQELEERKRKQEAEKKKRQEAEKKKEEEKKRNEKEIKKKEEEEKRKEEEEQRKEKEKKRKEEEEKRKKEELAKQKEEAKKRDEDAKKKLEEERRREEELKKQEEAKKEEADRRKQEEERERNEKQEKRIKKKGSEVKRGTVAQRLQEQQQKDEGTESEPQQPKTKETKPDLKEKPQEDDKKEIAKDEEAKKPAAAEHFPKGDCVVCGQLARTFCSSCKHVFYCRRDHQKSHWKTHKEDCRALGRLPYRVERNDLLGRHLVATRDLPAGTLILNELPLVAGPRQLSKPVCLGCHKELKDAKSCHSCSRCRWPLCSRRCEDSPNHEPECRLFRYGGAKVKVENFGQLNMMYACVTVLRALSLKEGSRAVWEDYTSFQSHLEERMKTEVYTKVNKEKVVLFIQHYLGLASKYSDLEILETCGRLDTNCFEIRQDGLNLRAMYRTACIVSHDCAPNTKHTFGKGNDINLYATRDIAKDSVISASYTQTLWNTSQRREHLKMSKCFWCGCDRCRDPSEFGTWLSCAICQNCGGRISATDPLDEKAEWSCDKCARRFPPADVSRLTDDLTKKLKTEVDRSDPESLERFLKDEAHLLPETHSLSREIQWGIVCIYKARLADMMDSAQLLRKSFLCKQLLAVADKIDPGLSKWRGQILFELQSSSVVLAQRAWKDGNLTAYQAKNIFEENADLLRQAVEILSVEPEEGKEEVQEEMKRLYKILEDMEEDEEET